MTNKKLFTDGFFSTFSIYPLKASFKGKRVVAKESFVKSSWSDDVLSLQQDLNFIYEDLNCSFQKLKNESKS